MKKCGMCEETLPLANFGMSKNKLQSYCKKCKVSWDKNYYKNNEARRISVRATNKRILERNRAYILSHLEANPCVDCGESDIMVLEFDHIDSKKSGVGPLASNLVSIKTLQAEIDKCLVRCCNCHRRKTIRQFGWWLDDSKVP